MIRLPRCCLAAVAAVAALAVVGCRDDDGDLEAFCARTEDPASVEELLATLDPTDVDAALEAFREVQDRQEALLDVAPEEAADDLRVVNEFVDDLVDGLAGAERTSEAPRIYDELRPRVAEVDAAADRLDQFVVDRCSDAPSRSSRPAG